MSATGCYNIILSLSGSKQVEAGNGLHSILSQKIGLFVTTTVRTSNPIYKVNDVSKKL
jgi:hypothetical protein